MKHIRSSNSSDTEQEGFFDHSMCHIMFEVLIISESSGQNFNIGAYNASNGQSLTSFKGGTSQPHTLCLINDEYIISSIPNKPVIQVYEIIRKNQQPKKVALPGIVRSLAVSNDGALLVAGINNNVLVWELAGGELLSILSRHYQNITCLSFSHDDSYLAASGDDGIVSVWDAALIWNQDSSETGSIEPYHSWTSHTASTSDMKFGLRYRVYSSSLDCSIKIHDIPSKQTIMTIVMDFGITSFGFTPSETFLFVGCSNGSLHRVNLLHCDHKNSMVPSTEEKERTEKNAHSKSILSVSCGLDGTNIITGSEDCEVKFWDVSSLQCLKTLKFTGKITNLLLVPTISGFSLTLNAKKSFTPFPKLQRQIMLSNNDADANSKYFKLVKYEDDE